MKKIIAGLWTVALLLPSLCHGADALKIGILYSTTGPYGSMGRDARDGAEFAIAEFAARSGRSVEPDAA